MAGDLALSVIVPLHDTARLLEQMIRTVARTERRDIEFVFVDDASTDDTVAVVERLAPLLPVVNLIQRDEMGSAYAARNVGLDAATAPAITFLDGDDWVAPGYLDRALALWEQRDVDVMRFDYTRVTGTSREIKHMPIGVRGRPVLARDYVLPARRTTIADYPTTWGGIIARDFVERHSLRFDERFATAGDREWWWRVILADGRMSFEDLNGYFYRKGVARSLTTVGDERTLHYLGVLARIDELVRADRDARALLPKVWGTVCSVVLFHLDHDERLSPELKAEHERRVRALLQSAPADAVPAATVGMATDALARLRGFGLPG